MTLKTRSCLHKESSQHTKNHHRALTTCRAGCASARQFRSCNDKKKKGMRKTKQQNPNSACVQDKICPSIRLASKWSTTYTIRNTPALEFTLRAFHRWCLYPSYLSHSQICTGVLSDSEPS